MLYVKAFLLCFCARINYLIFLYICQAWEGEPSIEAEFFLGNLKKKVDGNVTVFAEIKKMMGLKSLFVWYRINVL